MSPTTLVRCLLSPVTSWRAVQLMRQGHPDIPSFDVAWRRVRLSHHPDEAPYFRAGHQAPAAKNTAPQSNHSYPDPP
ncbi:hypothetical protein [Streptomyces anthocyanicus]|uniref:hypothetical protein n=1 Tax=Streptomyces anthocyanicus TaxID=68174 RepID=UPI0038114C91